MRVFLTGATGVIGRRAVPRLVAAGHAVTAVARSPGARAALERMDAATVTVDLFDARAVRAAVAGHDAVVNLATHIPRGNVGPFLPGAWRETDRLRREASAVLADAALATGARRFVQESFAPTYPDSGDAWIGESTPLRPAHYNRTVLDAERSAGRVTKGGGEGVALRFAVLYGPGDAFSRQLLDGVRRGWFAMFGRPEAYLSILHHDDAASAVAAALGVPPGVYNVVDDEPSTRRDLAVTLATLLGVRPPKLLPPWVARLAGSLGETLARSLRISNRELRRASSWTPSFPTAADGWRDVLASFPELSRAERHGAPGAVERADA